MDKRAVSAGQRRSLVGCALLPAALDLLQLPIAAAGREAWLCPLLALPVGLALCWAWQKAPEEFVCPWPVKLGYLLWGIVLLWGSGARSALRLERAAGSGAQPWAILLALAALTLYLARRQEVIARVGRVVFPALAVMLAGVLLLAVPALRWENLFPWRQEDLEGVPLGALWVLSLAGYAVYGRFLTAEREDSGQSGVWCLGGCGALAGLLLAVVGVFAPALALRMDEPFLYLLSGVGAPAFQRGEAMLGAVAALGDLALLGLLAQSCGRLWGDVFGRGRWAPTLVGFALALMFPGMGLELLTGTAGLMGGLLFGAIVPLIVLLPKKVPKEKESLTTFSGGESEKKEDVGANLAGKKSCDENEKKC